MQEDSTDNEVSPAIRHIWASQGELWCDAESQGPSDALENLPGMNPNKGAIQNVMGSPASRPPRMARRTRRRRTRLLEERVAEPAQRPAQNRVGYGVTYVICSHYNLNKEWQLFFQKNFFNRSWFCNKYCIVLYPFIKIKNSFITNHILFSINPNFLHTKCS